MSAAGKSKQQVRLAVDLLSSAGNEVMADLRIIAKDGGILPASRFVLGARSPVLQKMLYAEPNSNAEGGGGGSSSSSPRQQLRLNYTSGVVRALIYYCRSNEIEPYHSKDEACSRELVQLGDCASAFELDGLEDLVCETTAQLLESFPHLACAVFDEACGNETVERLKFLALGIVRRHPDTTLMKRNEFQNREPGVAYLHRSSLEEIMCDRRMCTEEVCMFRALAMWADCTPSPVSLERDGEDSGTTGKSYASKRDRKRLASQYVEKYIDLSAIAPSDLFGIVSDSGLVGADKISGALVQLALRAEKEGVNLSKARADVSQLNDRKPVSSGRGSRGDGFSGNFNNNNNGMNGNNNNNNNNNGRGSGGARFDYDDGLSVVSLATNGSPRSPEPQSPPQRRVHSPKQQKEPKKKVELSDVLEYMVGDRLDACCRYGRSGDPATL